MSDETAVCRRMRDPKSPWRMFGRESWVGLLGLSACLAATGCHSSFVEATVINQSGKPIQLLEIDYPSASFGTGNLVPGGTFKYRFKILGSGKVKAIWTDSAGKERTVAGPEIHEGQEGTLSVHLTPETASWQADLRP